MKTKLIYDTNITEFENKLNEFLEGKKIVDIKFTVPIVPYAEDNEERGADRKEWVEYEVRKYALVIYED